MRLDLLTIFPDLFCGVFDFGMIRQGREKGLLTIEVNDLRAYTNDRHQTVDDRPFGGGDGMVMKPEPIFDAVESLARPDDRNPHVVLMSPQGKRFDQAKAVELSLEPHLLLICGRYEGVDQRISDHLVDEEVSVGDFVLSGGEFAAMIVVDAIARLVPGVVSKSGSILQESFMDGLLDHPHYTRPAEFRGWKVPEVLLSGNHSAIDKWRRREAMCRTRRLRPDLLLTQDADNG